ncbi:hypothetical protein WMY93_033583, partial [Mugilogobius chulae]
CWIRQRKGNEAADFHVKTFASFVLESGFSALIQVLSEMEQNSQDLFIKPGNQERGWNDPPQFSYGLQTSRGATRSALSRRAPPAGQRTTPTAPPTGHTAAPPAGQRAPPTAPPTGHTAAPPAAAPPPPIGSRVAPPPASAPITAQRDSVQSEPEPEVEEVMSVLEGALEACRGNAAADDAHRSLMVDHVTEVSQWWSESKSHRRTRKLNPEQLRPLTRQQDQDQDQDQNQDQDQEKNLDQNQDQNEDQDVDQHQDQEQL